MSVAITKWSPVLTQRMSQLQAIQYQDAREQQTRLSATTHPKQHFIVVEQTHMHKLQLGQNRARMQFSPFTQHWMFACFLARLTSVFIAKVHQHKHNYNIMEPVHALMLALQV
jgi:hypothetical protein